MTRETIYVVQAFNAGKGKSLRVCPKSLAGITKSSEHEPD